MSLGLLSASVAHELNTPLTVLQGSIEKLTENHRAIPPLWSAWPACCESRSGFATSAKSLVDFSRVRKQHLEPVPLRQSDR